MGVKERLDDMPVVGTALRVQQRYTDDAADPLAAAIGFFGFLSLFPLMLLAVSVAGFVLQDPADQIEVVTSITEAIPGFEETAEGEGSSGVADLVAGVVAQRGTVGVVGIILLLFSGLRVVNAAMVSTRVVWRGGELKGVGNKLRQILALAGLGVLALLGVAGSSLAGTGLGELPAVVAVLLSSVVSFAFDLLLFFGAYTLLSPTSTLSARQRLPGAVLGAAGWTALKVAGSAYVGNQVESANALYGALGGVIALMLLFYLAGRLYLYGAELSAVLVEQRDGPITPPPDDDASDAPADDRRGSARTARSARLSSVPAGLAAHRAVMGRPTDPGPSDRAPTITTPTHERLADAERRHAAEAAAREPGRDARTAVAFGLGIAALVAGWRFLGRGRQ